MQQIFFVCGVDLPQTRAEQACNEPRKAKRTGNFRGMLLPHPSGGATAVNILHFFDLFLCSLLLYFVAFSCVCGSVPRQASATNNSFFIFHF